MHSKGFTDLTAFFSCANKTGIPEIASELHKRNWTIYSAGGTAKAIAEFGTPVIDIATLPGSVGEMLKHRLLTLQPAVHGPLLASEDPAHREELRRLGLPLSYELVVIDLYPFEDAVEAFKMKAKSFNEVWEMIDVGGPAMLKSAIKGRKFPVVMSERREDLLQWIGDDCPDFRVAHRAALKEAIAYVAQREVKHAQFIELYLNGD